MTEITRILDAMEQGDPHAAAQLLPLVYDELRRLAASRLSQEQPGHTLEATALVHEAYLKLVGPDAGHRWNDRRHFFAAAAEAMRRILVDHSRKKRAERRGGDRQRVPLAQAGAVAAPDADDVLALDEVLDRFAGVEPLKAELVKLRYFAGLSEAEAAAAMGIARATASRWWTYARAWLIDALEEKLDNPAAS
jgi:RNA polymerase sigma factor (TIGR02999 family)